MAIYRVEFEWAREQLPQKPTLKDAFELAEVIPQTEEWCENLSCYLLLSVLNLQPTYDTDEDDPFADDIQVLYTNEENRFLPGLEINSLLLDGPPERDDILKEIHQEYLRLQQDLSLPVRLSIFKLNSNEE